MTRIFLILLVTLFSTAARSETPDEMVAGYLTSISSYDFTRAVEYYAESDCVQFKRMLVPLLQREAESGKSDLSRMLFGRALDLQQISAMHSCEFVAKSISSLSAASNARSVPKSNPTAKIIGSVKESDALVHYVIRSTAMLGEIPVSSMEIVSVKREAGIWHVQMSEKMKGMSSVVARTLKQQAGGSDKTLKADAPGQPRP